MAWFSSSRLKKVWFRSLARIQVLDELHSLFPFCFVPRFPGPGGHNGDTVMFREILVGAVELWFIATGFGDANLGVVGYEQLG